MAVTYYDPSATLGAITAATSFTQLTTAMGDLGNVYGLTFRFWTTTPDGALSYAAGSDIFTAADLPRAKQGASIYAQEIVKYQPAFIQATTINAINFVRNTLAYQSNLNEAFAYATLGEFWTVTPSDLATPASAQNMARVFHHEYFHLIDATWTGADGLDYVAWNAVNPAGFVYGTTTSVLPDGHPLGFIDAYAQTDQVEDSAQVHSALMAEPRYDLLQQWLTNDTALQTKVALHHAFLGKHSPVMGAEAYYQGVNGLATVDPGGGGTDPVDDSPITGPGYTTEIEVGVWRHLTGTTWGKVGSVSTWASLSVEPRHLQAGPWSLQLPYDQQTAKITKQNLLTFDFRGERFTGVVGHVGPQESDDGYGITLELSGSDALTLLGDATCWPVPTAGLDGQNVLRWSITAPAETACRALIIANIPRLYDIAVPSSKGRGPTVSFNVRFHNLLNQVLAKCAIGGLGVRVGLNQVADSSTRATLTCWFYVPQDRSVRVRLSNKVGTLAAWSQADDAPTATRAIVGGGGAGVERVFRQVVQAAAESEWARKIETFVDASDTFDATTLDQRGQEELLNTAEQSSFDLTAMDSSGMRYGDHFTVGDTVTIELATGISKTDVLSAATLTSDSNGTAIALKPGSLDNTNPLFTQAAIIRGLRTQVRALQQED